MKKIVLLTIITSFFLFSCEKDNDEVKKTVNDLDEVSKFHYSITEQLSDIDYSSIYNSNNQELKNIYNILFDFKLASKRRIAETGDDPLLNFKNIGIYKFECKKENFYSEVDVSFDSIYLKYNKNIKFDSIEYSYIITTSLKDYNMEYVCPNNISIVSTKRLSTKQYQNKITNTFCDSGFKGENGNIYYSFDLSTSFMCTNYSSEFGFPNNNVNGYFDYYSSFYHQDISPDSLFIDNMINGFKILISNLLHSKISKEETCYSKYYYEGNKPIYSNAISTNVINGINKVYFLDVNHNNLEINNLKNIKYIAFDDSILINNKYIKYKQLFKKIIL